jgi:hypothetical protein
MNKEIATPTPTQATPQAAPKVEPVKAKEKTVEPINKLEKVIEGLANECENEEESTNLRRAFLLYGLHFMEERTFDKEVKRLTKMGFSRRLLKNGVHLVEDLNTVAIAVQDHKHFGTALEVALKDRQTIDGNNKEKELAYIKKHIDIAALNIEDCIDTMEDLDPDTIRMRIPGGSKIQTASKFGRDIETLCNIYGRPQYNTEIRQAFCGWAVGTLNRTTMAEIMDKHKKFLKKIAYENVIKRGSDNLFELFNKITIYNYEPKLVAAWLSRVRPPVALADWEYLTQVLGKVPKEKLLYADEVEPLTEEDLVLAKQLMTNKAKQIDNIRNNQ